MYRGCRRRVLLGLAAAALVGMVLRAAAQSPPPPLTNEDVVRLLEAGTPVAAVLERIRSNPPAFDLTPEIVEELRQAHVPEEILRAMRERQESLPSPAPGGAEEEGVEPRVHVVMRIESESAERHRSPAARLEIPARLDPATAAKLGIEDAEDSPPVEDVALFLACITPEHVPDGWKFGSPLARDFPRMPRHEMLAFISKASLEGAPNRPKEAPRSVVLAIPPSLEAEVTPGASHDWYFGVAILAGGRWRVIASASTRLDSAADPSPLLVGSIRISKRDPFAPELNLRSAGTRSSTPPPPPS